MEEGIGPAPCGIGDGYGAGGAGRIPPHLFLGQQQPVFIIEPDMRVLWGVLALHDFSGPDGPIVQARFRWFAGPGWAEQFQREILEHPALRFPDAQLYMGIEPALVEKVFRQAADAVTEADHKMADMIAEIYADVDARARRSCSARTHRGGRASC